MLKVHKSELYKVDERGIKSQIREKNTHFDGVEVVTCPKAKVRGNHFHKNKTEYVHVFSGLVEIEVLSTANDKSKFLLKPGEYVIIPPLTKHRITGIEDSVLVVPFQGLSSLEDSYKWE